MATKEKPTWQAVDIDRLAGPSKTAWEAYAKARAPIIEQKKALDAKLQPQQTALENAIVADLRSAGMVTAGQEVLFGYRFGGLGVAIVDAVNNTGKAKLVLGHATGSKRR